MTKESKSIEELYEIMEMINYEMSVRNSDKLMIMEEITN